MMSSMGNMDMNVGMPHDCHSDMQADTEVIMDHCASDIEKHEGCDESNCGSCVSHCSSAVIADISLITASVPPLPVFQYLLTEAISIHTRMLRPPQIV